MTIRRLPIALTIAGSDSGGGAGIQADLKTFQPFGVHGLSVITSVTAQNSESIIRSFDLPSSMITAQLEALFSDFKIAAAKTGMLSNPKIVDAIAVFLKHKKIKNLIVDPAMLSKSDFPLLKVTALQSLKKRLLPIALLVTPNLPEAEVLSGLTIRSADAMKAAAQKIRQFGPNVLIKGGHAKFKPGVDLFFDGKTFHEIPGKFSPGKRPHGTGCVYSAAITAYLAKGEPLHDAIKKAKRFVEDAIAKSKKIGKGNPFLYFI